jgi:type III pantothenate kinase
MFLALDIGNTNITAGLFAIKDEKVLPEPLKVWRISTVKEQTSNKYAMLFMNMFFYAGFDAKKISNFAVASVVPSLNAVFEEFIKKYFGKKIFFVNQKNCGDLVFALGNSKEAGADRIANVVAAYSVYSDSCIVIDFGTATTFDCVSSEGIYIGGAIAPGLAISAQLLNLKTEQLPRIEIKKPLKSIGLTTVECMQSGLYFGYIGLVKELIVRIKSEIEVKHVIATGGLAGLVFDEIKEIEIILPYLTLMGIRIIWGKSNLNIGN